MIEGLKPYAEHKESGSNWLGAVPAKWEVRNLRIARRNERNRADLPLLSVAREKGVFVRSLKEEDLAKGILDAIDMDSYRAEKQATMAIALPDADAEIEPVPTSGGGRKPEPEMDKLSNIVKAFNDQYAKGYDDPERTLRRITGEIPEKVSNDQAYRNAKRNSDRQNARIEHDKALKRVITAMFKDDAQLFKQFQDNESFRHWLTDTVFGMTYEG